MNPRIRILIADDHVFFREGMVAMFTGHPEIELLDQAADGRFLLTMVEKYRPDVVLTDVQMENVDGFEVARQISKNYPGISVIALSMYFDNYAIMEMIRAGACGYVVKDAGPDVVTKAIKAAYRGLTYYCHTASRQVAALISSGQFDPARPDIQNFTPTELRIIRLIYADTDNKDICALLSISNITLKRYRAEIFEKAGVKSLVGLVVYAMKNGLVR